MTIEAILAQVGVPVLSRILSDALREVDHSTAKTASEALKALDQAIKNGGISQEQLEEANRHTEKMAELHSAAFTNIFSEINESLRTEVASQDKYVRRMRPTFGYLMAFTWAAQMFAIAYVIVFQTGQAGVVIASMSSLTAIWGVGLSVLGIYVYKRSEDKKLNGNEVIFWNKKN